MVYEVEVYCCLSLGYILEGPKSTSDNCLGPDICTSKTRDEIRFPHYQWLLFLMIHGPNAISLNVTHDYDSISNATVHEEVNVLKASFGMFREGSVAQNFK